MRKILFLAVLMLCSLGVSAKEKNKKVKRPAIRPVYLYAVSTSFNDTVAYVTDIQRVDSAYMEKKHILGGLRDYVQQVEAHYKQKGEPRRLNTVFFKKDRKKAEKKYVKLRKKFTKMGYAIKALPEGEFSFKSVLPPEEE